MTKVELYNKVVDGRMSCCLEVNEGTGCSGCPYEEFSDGTGDRFGNPCRDRLSEDEEKLIDILNKIDSFGEGVSS